VPIVYETVAVPDEVPVTIPVDAPIETLPDPGLVLHVPPEVGSVNVVVDSSHTNNVPEILEGSTAGLMVTIAVTKQPAAIV
jgi:hypothetical protein